MWKHTLLSVSRRGNSTGPEYKHTKNILITRWVVTWYLCPSPLKRKNGCTTTTKNSTPGGGTERALKRLVFGNTSDGLIHHHQKHPIWFVCVTLLLRHTVAVIRGYDQNNSQWLNMPRCALHKIERRCCFRIAERRSKAYERFFGGSLSGVREKDSKQQVDTLTLRHKEKFG